jgi:hypothetical protein
MLHNVDADTKEDTMRLLIDHGANVAAQDEYHSTPLHLAALGGNTRAVRLLIEHGADVAARDRNHRTPLHLASSRRVGVRTIQRFIEHRLTFTDRTKGPKRDFMRARTAARLTQC